MHEVDTAALRWYMDKAGIRTILDLSDATGINRNTLSGVLKGTVYPSSDVMGRMVSALGIPPEKAGAIFFSQKLA